MDRERDRDAATSMIEEHDKKVGDSVAERERPGQDDASSKPVDAQKPPEIERKKPAEEQEPGRSDPGPLSPQ